MTTLTLKGNPVHTLGQLPLLGTKAPDFTLTGTDLSEISLQQYQGKKIILSLFPSIDTPTCAQSVRHFNQTANELPDTFIFCISADLPFAQKRFCGAENLNKVIPLSTFRHPEFGQHYGVTLIDGPIAGLLSRALIIIDTDGKISYTQQVAEITQEPNYAECLAHL